MNYRRQAEALAERLYTEEFSCHEHDAKGACRAAANKFELLDFSVKRCAREIPERASCRAAFRWVAQCRGLENADQLFDQLYPLIAERTEDLIYAAIENGGDDAVLELTCRSDAIDQILQEHCGSSLTFPAGEAWLR